MLIIDKEFAKLDAADDDESLTAQNVSMDDAMRDVFAGRKK